MAGDDEKTAEELEVELRSNAAAPALAALVQGGKSVGAELVLSLVTSFSTGTPLTGADAVRALLQGLVSAASAGTAARQRARQITEQEGLEDLGKHAEEVRRNVGLMQAQGLGSASDVSAVLEDFLEAWAKAKDRRMREVATRVAVNSFDPERVKEGLGRTVMRIVSELEYGAIEKLRVVRSEDSRPVQITGSLDEYYFERLEHFRLVRIRPVKVNAAYLDRNHAQQLEETPYVRRTELGDAVLRFIAEAKLHDDVDQAVKRGQSEGT